VAGQPVTRAYEPPAPLPPGEATTPAEARHLRDLSPEQWKSGVAAWLGWLFDGLDMQLYTLVAAPFVMELLHVASAADPMVREKSSWIQAAFLVGWALGGAFFGRLGDRLGRSRALSLTILTYAAFTGLSFVAQTWWHLLAFRFLAALGVGGEWAVGSSLLSETWPSRWRPWIAAVLQAGVNIGILLACLAVYVLAGFPPRTVFLVGILPALLVFWIRRNVPEPAEWLTRESWSAKGEVKELRKAYEGFHRDVRNVLEACPDCHKWAILEREPLPRWSDGRVVLLGDAAHPMTPYMAQGAATSIEDAAILARCLDAVNGEDIEGAFKRYENHRKPRTSVVQAISSANTWMREGDGDTSWLYGYDAWNANLDQPAAHPRPQAA